MATTRSAAIGTALILLGAALAPSGCAQKVECAPGTVARGDTCVAICEDGTEPHPTTGACVPVCMPGTQRDSGTGACMPLNAKCVSGEVWDPEGEICISLEGLCAPGSVWVAGESRCVLVEDLLVADQFEGDEPNNWRGGYGHSCERFELPAVGETWSLGGRVDPPGEDGMPDLDCWNFTTDEPVLLRIRADGIGGVAAAFMVVPDDDGTRSTQRAAAGTSSSSVTRDVFLPRVTQYALVVSDVLHIIESGIVRGSSDFGYYVEIERLPIPEPTEISGSGVIARGRWSEDQREQGTDLGFYELAFEKHTLAYLGLHSDGWLALQLFVGITSDGEILEADFRYQPFANAFDHDGTMLVVADYEWWFAGEGAVDYRITLEPQPFQLVGAGETSLDVHRPAWRGPGGLPTSYFGFDVRAGEVQRMTLTTSSGYTCFGVWNHAFNWLADQVGCFLIAEPIHEFEINFMPEKDGLWVLAVTDWSDGVYSSGGLVRLPARDIKVDVGIYPQVPLTLGDLSSPLISEELFTPERPERWLSLAPSEAGQAFRFRVESEQVWPHFSVYDYGDILATPTRRFTAQRPSLVLRSPDGAPRLLSIRDPFMDSGSFTLIAERYEPVRLDIPTSGELDTTVTLPAGEEVFFEVTAEQPADLVMTITPPPDAAISYQPTRPDYRLAERYRVAGGGAGEPVEVVQGLKPTPFAFQIVDAWGWPLFQDVEVRIEAKLVPLMVEEEPNDTPQQANLLPLSTPVAGSMLYRGDLDWYRVEIDEPMVVEIDTRPLGLGNFGYADLWILDSELREVVSGIEWLGENLLHRMARVTLNEPGELYVFVRPYGDDWEGYVIEARPFTNN